MRRWPKGQRILPTQIASRLYGLGALGGLAVLLLTIAAIYFASSTHRAADYLYDQGVVGVVEAGELQLLLERHRRIIEAAPVEFDRERIDRDRQASEAILDRLGTLSGRRHDYYLNSISELVPPLTQLSRKVLYLVAHFAQDRALEALEKYNKIADRIQRQIGRFQKDRLATADQHVTSLERRADSLVAWVLVYAAFAVLFVAPLSYHVVHNIAVRLKELTTRMRQLAENDTSITVRYLSDRDELGDMARALQIFRMNAVAILEQRKQLKTLNFRIDVALNNMGRGLSMFDRHENLVVANEMFKTIYRMPDDLCLPGTPFAKILEHRLRFGRVKITGDATDPEKWHNTYSTKVAAGSPFDVNYEMHDGRMIQITYRPMGEGGCVALHEDITEKRQAEEKIRRLAKLDTLTGLANRHYFRQTLRKALKDTREGPSGKGFALTLIDLDLFKEVNDTLGHPAGDEVLKQVSKRLRDAVRDIDLVARLGGDEFAVLMQSVTDKDMAATAAKRILDSLKSSYFVHGQHITIGASIGIACVPEHADSHNEILKKADIALYRAKDQGRCQVQIFEENLEVQLREKRLIETDLRQALDKQQLELHYQPIIDLKAGCVTSCEALMRWHHPSRGNVPPSQFIPLAEDLGLINEFGAWALKQACKDAAKWPRNVAVAVNLSAVQFASENFYETVQNALADAKLAPKRLILEVTESLLLDNTTDTRSVLHRLREQGTQIALDDFGTGYASLSYLKSFPFDKIKIDQTFVRTAGGDEQNIAIVRAVANLAQTLGMKAVAEGVETVSHLQKVFDAGCDEVQGYLFSKPVKRREIMHVINKCRRQLERAA